MSIPENMKQITDLVSLLIDNTNLISKEVMEKFEFKSAICTSVEQSKRLLELGLKKETADMYYGYYKDRIGYSWYLTPKPATLGDKRSIPAWSLHRLIELYSEVEDASSLCIKNVSYKLLIFCIEKAIHCGLFNKDYLGERK